MGILFKPLMPAINHWSECLFPFNCNVNYSYSLFLCTLKNSVHKGQIQPLLHD